MARALKACPEIGARVARVERFEDERPISFMDADELAALERALGEEGRADG